MNKTHDRRPPGGHKFEAVYLKPEGWVCLTPRIYTPDGKWYRSHIEALGQKQLAEHIAAQLNADVSDPEFSP